ncbi:MAG: MFS transporter [Gallionella sp.]|nr:MFS transporter [Gallionella sp.]
MQNAVYTMTATERRASIGLASIYGLRMLGLFIILPVFALYAEHLPGGESHLLIGIALGAYGLTQAILQIPAGWLSDRYGRKPVIYASLILFALGSFIAAYAGDIYWVIIGRVVQGAGALNAAVMALTADLTREEVRTKAMAMIGITIGVTFSLSMVLSPLLGGVLGVPGIFAMTGVLALLAMLVVRFVIPDPAITRFHSDTEASSTRFGEVLRNKDLLRLNFGIFTVHAILMSVFMRVPLLLQADGMEVSQHWKIYLPVMAVAFVLMLPFIIIAGKKGRMKPVFMLSIALAMVSQVMLLAQHSLWGVTAALLVFFTAFNVLEAKLPSLISVIAPLAAKGTAMGVYSSVQFFGAFFGASVGGALTQFAGGDAVFVFAIVLLLLWLVVASGMQPPADVRTRMYHLPGMSDAVAVELRRCLAQLSGVREVMVVAAENIACLKVDMQGFDEAAVDRLVMTPPQPFPAKSPSL